jgi:hypothetical protein
MQQHRYYAEHHDTGPGERFDSASGAPNGNSSTIRSESSARLARRDQLPEFVQPGPQAGDLASIRFLAARKLRRLDIEGPSPLMLSINGRTVGLVHPGENSFDPPVPLESGDTLQLEAIDPAEVGNASCLSGWTPSSSTSNESGARGGDHV